MSLSNASVQSGATMAPTGGSALAFESAGIRDRVHKVFATADTDLRTRREIVATVKEPVPSASAPNGSTQARASATVKLPLALDNGNSTVNTVRIELSYDPETITSEIDELRIVAAQVLTDSDFDALWEGLSLA